jgi:hypothetical protein
MSNPSNTTTSVAVESLRLEFARYRTRARLIQLSLAVLILGAWTNGAGRGDVLRVRGLIVEDSLGRARVVIGAPMALPGRTAGTSGAGIAVLTTEGRLQVAMGAPTPAPQISGRVVTRVAANAGFVIADPNGDERGGMATFADGRSNVCLDYTAGVKEAACLSVAPSDQYAGLVVNGLPSERAFDRVTALVTSGGGAVMKIATPSGRESAILTSQGDGPAKLFVYDSLGDQFVDVMPRHR